jgi:hypothetical protein
VLREFHFGGCLESGGRIEPNLECAADYFEFSTSHGDANCEESYASYLEQSKGIKQDQNLARKD